MLIKIELDARELEKLEQAVYFYEDKGPIPNGWTSDLMDTVQDKVRNAIKEAKNGEI